MGNRLIIPAVSDLFPPSSSSPPPFSFYNRCKIRRIGDVLKRAWEILYFLSWDFIIAREVSFEELPKIKKYMKRRSFTCIISSIPCHEREKRERGKKKSSEKSLKREYMYYPSENKPSKSRAQGNKGGFVVVDDRCRAFCIDIAAIYFQFPWACTGMAFPGRGNWRKPKKKRGGVARRGGTAESGMTAGRGEGWGREGRWRKVGRLV